MKTILTSLLIFIHSIQAFSQDSPYEVSSSRESVLIGIGVAGLAHSLRIGNSIQALPAHILVNLNRNSINSFDRSATYNYSASARKRSDIGAYGSFGLTASTLFMVNSRKQLYQLFVIGFEANLFNLAAMQFTKNSTLRIRPFMYNPDVPIENKLDIDGQKSFFSGHTSTSATNCFLLARFHADLFPDSKYNKYIWTAAAIIPAWVAMERYWAGKHFPTDVIAGYAIGAGIGYFLPKLHYKKDKRATTRHLSPIIAPSMYGFNYSLRF